MDVLSAEFLFGTEAGPMVVRFDYRGRRPVDVVVLDESERVLLWVDNAAGRERPCVTRARDVLRRALRPPRSDHAKVRRKESRPKLRVKG